MNAYFGTAIIIKLYVQEATSPDAVRLVGESAAPYLLMPWQEIEVLTAIRLKAFRKEITGNHGHGNASLVGRLSGRHPFASLEGASLHAAPRLGIGPRPFRAPRCHSRLPDA
jgi:hypothetical protein